MDSRRMRYRSRPLLSSAYCNDSNHSRVSAGSTWSWRVEPVVPQAAHHHPRIFASAMGFLHSCGNGHCVKPCTNRAILIVFDLRPIVKDAYAVWRTFYPRHRCGNRLYRLPTPQSSTVDNAAVLTSCTNSGGYAQSEQTGRRRDLT